MKIQLKITRTELKPKEKRDIYYQNLNDSLYEIYEVLDVEITEKQFEVIRKAVLEVF